jgi:hypothetical protein
VFVGVLVIQGIINYYAHQSLKGLQNGVVALIMSGILTLINMAWRILCRKMTVFEKHLYWSEYRKWDCFKTFVFKIFNVMVLYAVKVQTVDTNECTLESMGNQFTILILMDITFNSILEIFMPFVRSKLSSKTAQQSESSNDASRPEFILSDEYVEVMYRQFIVGLGLLVVPMLPLLALIANLIEYWLDKIRMLRIAQKPKRTHNSFKSVLVFFFALIGLAITCAYPNGAVWILNGEYKAVGAGCGVYA